MSLFLSSLPLWLGARRPPWFPDEFLWVVGCTHTGLSAGRVQSVAVRLIVDREKDRLAFRPATYWDLEAQLSGEGRTFTAMLARLGDARVATVAAGSSQIQRNLIANLMGHKVQ